MHLCRYEILCACFVQLVNIWSAFSPAYCAFLSSYRKYLRNAMTSRQPCLVTNLAIVGATSGYVLCFVIDAAIRKVPPLIAKARVAVLAILIMDIITEVLALYNAAVRLRVWFLALTSPVTFYSTLYWCEHVMGICVNTAVNNDMRYGKHVDFVTRSFPWIRGIVLSYFTTICIVFTIAPMNAVMSAFHFGSAFVWLLAIVFGSVVLYFTYLLRQHVKVEVRMCGHIGILRFHAAS